MQFLPQAGDFELLTSGAFAISLIYVGYGYTGWNAATYLIGEVEHPQKSLPKILGLGTLIVLVLYVWLNAVFLLAAPIDVMVGQEEIGYIAAAATFGQTGGQFAGSILALLLISTVSAMTIAGPRVLQMMGEDEKLFSPLARTNKDGLPVTAIWLQSIIALVFVVFSSFESVLVFSGFTLAMNSFLAVAGIFILRWRKSDIERPFSVPLFPLTPLVFLGLTGWTLTYVAIERPIETLFAVGLLGSGLVVWGVTRIIQR